MDVCYLAAHVEPTYRPSGYQVVRIGPPNPLRKYGLFFDAPHLYAKLRRLRPSIVFQQVGCAYTGVAAWYAKQHDCPMVWRISSDASLDSPWPSWWRRPHAYLETYLLRLGIRHATSIVAQTHHQLALLEKNFQRSDAVVIRNFHPAPQEKLEKSGVFRVVWVANLKRLKQPEVFLRLAQRFKRRRDVQFIVIGGEGDDPRWVSNIKEQLRELGNVDYRGRLSQDEVNAILSSAHVLVNTSVYEGFPNVFVQAWMREVAVLSLVVDPDGVLSKRGLGRLAGSEQQLATDLAELMENPGQLSRITEAARAYALRYHSTQNTAQLVELIRGLVHRGGPDGTM